MFENPFKYTEKHGELDESIISDIARRPVFAKIQWIFIIFCESHRQENKHT